MKRFLPLLAAFAAFQVFNYSATDYALTDLLGDLAVLGVRWAAILAAAFCAIDLVGISLFAHNDDSGNAWYFFGAWALAAALNATITWWGLSLVLAHQAESIIPALIAVFAWGVRVLIVATCFLGAASFARVRSFG